MHTTLRFAALGTLVVLGLLLFGPQQLGGPVAAVSTHGQSMLPTFRPHHLVGVVRATDYDVGDVVAYHSETLDTVVLHRIVGGDDEGFVTRGDNNDWEDPDRPSADELVGRAWFAVPGYGRLLELPAPVRAAVPLLAAGVGLLVAGVQGRRSSPSRRRTPRRTPRTASPGAAPTFGADARAVVVGLPRQLLTTGLVVGLLAAGAAVVGFTQPSRVAGPVDHVQRVTFSYETPVPASPAYPDGRIDGGEPVFLRIVDRIPVRARWTLASDAVIAVRGRGRLVATVSDASGWRTTVPVGPEQSWEGTRATLDGEVDFAALARMADEVVRTTGVAAGTRTVEVVAEVELEGQVAGAELVTSFAPVVTFRVDALRALLVTDVAVQDGSEPEAGRTLEGTVMAAAAAPNTVAVTGRQVPISTLRTASLVAGAVGATLCVVGFALGRRRRGWDEDRRIADRHGDVLVEVAALTAAGDRSVVRVVGIEALADLARRRDLPLLKVPMRTGGHGYVVEDASARYGYPVHVPCDDDPVTGTAAGGRAPTR